MNNDQLAATLQRSAEHLEMMLKAFSDQILKAQLELTSHEELERQVRFLQGRRSEMDSRLAQTEGMVDNLRKRVVQLEDGPMWLHPLQKDVEDTVASIRKIERIATSIHKRLHALDQLHAPEEPTHD